VTSSSDDTVTVLHSRLKAASQCSGIRGRPSVLLVHEDLGVECIDDVCAFLKDGTVARCISLFDFHIYSVTEACSGIDLVCV